VEQLQIRQHLRVCRDCEEEHASLLMTKRLVSSLSMKTPRAGLEVEILQRLAQEGEPGSSRFHWRLWWSLQPETHRRGVRLGGLCLGVGAAALLLSMAPLSGTRSQPVSLARVATGAPGQSEPRLHFRDLQFLHESFDRAHPAATAAGERYQPYYGPPLTAASSTEYSTVSNER
jgi:hypothetical protein